MNRDVLAATALAICAPLLGVTIVWYASDVLQTPPPAQHTAALGEAPVAEEDDEVPVVAEDGAEEEVSAVQTGEDEYSGPVYVQRNWDVAPFTSEASAAFMIHEKSGHVLFSKEAYETRSIASLSKLMAALVAVEGLDVKSEFTVSENAASTPGKSAGLVAGERLTVEDALYAALLESGNDAVVALEDYYNALHPSSTGSAFVARMNALAAEKGLVNTKFAEPTGLSPQNRSSAREVGAMMAAAYAHPTLRTILSVRLYSVGNHLWETTNTLLDKEPGIEAAKTGYTEEAGQSLALVGRTDSDEIVVLVVLDASGDRIAEGARMWRWVQEAYAWEG